MKKAFTPLEKVSDKLSKKELNMDNSLSQPVRKNFLTGFTLMELLVVLVIMGILATLGLTHYGGIRENALDKEADANLKLIIAAERIWQMEATNNNYFPSSVGTAEAIIANINTNLKLSLPAGTSRNWNYDTFVNNTAIPKTTCAQATRSIATGFSGAGRTRRMRYSTNINYTEDVPVLGSCP